jgi:hypothetical protein
MAKQLGLTMQRQQHSNWCWAAVAASVAHFFDKSSQWTQCVLASQQLNQPNNGCCTNGDDPDTCNQVSHLEKSLSLIRHRNPDTDNPSDGIASPEVIKQEIDLGRPIGVRIGWDDSLDQGHFILVTGYDDGTPDLTVMINDPENPDGSPPSKCPYSALEHGYLSESGVWKNTYFII